jgi:hypothetical protein
MSGPTAIVAVPATQVPDLRGRRVIVGVPGLGFRADLRADDRIVQGGRSFVPVLTEQDFYRAESEQIEVFAPLVPIDRVWVESSHGTTQAPALSGEPLDAPSMRTPVEASNYPNTMGRRLIQAVPDGYIRDLRGMSDVYHDESGRACIRVCDESQWYRWAYSGKTPEAATVEARLLWVE